MSAFASSPGTDDPPQDPPHPDDLAGLAADEAAATVVGGPFDETAVQANATFTDENGNPLTQEQFDAAVQEYAEHYHQLVLKNKAIETSTFEVYGMSMTNGDKAMIRLNALIDFMIPPGTPERLLFEGAFEQALFPHLIKFKEQVETEVRKSQLITPTSRTATPPNRPMVLPDLRKR